MVVLTRLLVALALACGTAVTPVLTAPPAAAASPSPAPVVSHLRTNDLPDPLGISGEPPRLSWQLDADRRGVTQTAYQVRVATSAGALGSDPVWDSGKVDSRDSVDVRYDGPQLADHTSYRWTVRVWDDAGAASDWSRPASFETALLDQSDWKADWIGAGDGSAVGPEWTDYTVEFTASDISGALGVYFRGRDTEHAYMWQLSESEHALRPHVKNNGYSVLSPTPFPAGFDFAAEHDYAVEVDGDTITTTVDGKQLDRRTDGTHSAPGIVGFRTNGEETGLVHDVTVTTKAGKVLLDTDFPSGDRTFTAGTVTDDGLLLDGNAESWLAIGAEVPLLRKDFRLADKAVRSARVYASAEGLYELHLNGHAIGDRELAPGWTDYRKRIQYQTYDVTDQVTSGDNAIGAELANGWYAGRVAMFGDQIYGSKTALVAQLRVEYADGTSQVVTTDDSWRTTPGPTTSADLLDGESYDARRAQEIGAWQQPGYDDAGWSTAVVRPSATDRLEPQDDQPVRENQTLHPTRLDSPTAGAYIYDLGQNMVGKAHVTLTGKPGQTVRIRYAEVLNPDGSLYTANLRSAKATDYYTFATDQPETFEPSFTFHGFRYIEITGLDSAPSADHVSGVVMGTDGDLVSDFKTSSALVNQLHSNIVWGMRGNFLSIPTDTPARDERMGWTGDINVFSRTAVYNMDAQAFLNKWLQDLRDTQRADGAFPGVAPVIPGRFDGGYGPAGWADAGVHVPWTVWQAYGDTRVVRDNYESMKKYVDYLDADSTGHIRSAGGYLDWLNLDDPTPAEVIDTAFVAKSTREFAQMAGAIGKTDVAQAYTDRYQAIKKAYDDAFVADDGTVRGDSQTAYILTITNDLVPAGKEKALTDQFVETIKRRDWHLSIGFLGVDGLLPALSKVGRTDVAYRLLQNTDYPSWGYEIGKGATTVWERWNSIMPDGSFGPVGMNSFNHYAYGSAGEWMYRTLAGVSALEPGYRKVLVAPESGHGVSWADYSHRTPYGTVATSWKQTDEGMTLDVTVPGNSTAQVRMPTTGRWAVTEGGRPAEDAKGVRFVKMDGDTAVYAVGSGSYSFATDATLGRIGAARADVGAVQDIADALAEDGSIAPSVGKHLDAQLAKLDREVGSAWTTYLDGDDEAAASDVHRALSTAADLERWIDTQTDVGRIAPADADRLRSGLDRVRRELSAASARLVGAVASLVPPADEQLPGETAPVRVVVENKGSSTLKSLTTSLDVPDGWTASPHGTQAGSVAPGETVTHLYDVTIPADARPGSRQIDGTVSYQYQSSSANLPVSGSLMVVPAVVAESTSVDPQKASPGDTATVETVLKNRGDTARSGTLTLDVPDGWSAPDPEPFTVPASGSTTVSTEVEVPLSVTEGSAALTASVGDTAAERATASLDVTFVNPPALVVDHVDLGNADSEKNHGLTASASSGTNTEAGLTRRYTNSASPGGWFEFDLDVPAGKPFVMRAVETYDHPQLKTYDILVDGTVVHQRRYQRTDGEGSLSYQFVVDEPDLTEDGTVRVRFQDVGADYDPSIADVWAMPARGGLDGADLATGATVTARTSLEGGDWGVANLVDGRRESVAGGPKGYTSDPPSDTAAADEWVRLDLGEQRTFDTVVLYPRTETADDKPNDGTAGAHFPRDFTIQVSPDGSDWETVRTVTDQPDPGATPQDYGFDEATARYLRVAVTTLGRPTVEEGDRGFHRLQLAEVEVRHLSG